MLFVFLFLSRSHLLHAVLTYIGVNATRQSTISQKPIHNLYGKAPVYSATGFILIANKLPADKPNTKCKFGICNIRAIAAIILIHNTGDKIIKKTKNTCGPINKSSVSCSTSVLCEFLSILFIKNGVTKHTVQIIRTIKNIVTHPVAHLTIFTTNNIVINQIIIININKKLIQPFSFLISVNPLRYIDGGLAKY